SEQRRRQSERRDDEHAPNHDRASSEERVAKVVPVRTHSHPLELASQVLEDSARPWIGEQVAEQFVLAMPKRACRTGPRSLIVLPPPRRIDQHGVSLANLPEVLGRSRVAWAAIGMPVESLPPVGAANLFLGGRPGDTEDRVVVLVETCSGHCVSLPMTRSAHHTAHEATANACCQENGRPTVVWANLNIIERTALHDGSTAAS